MMSKKSAMKIIIIFDLFGTFVDIPYKEIPGMNDEVKYKLLTGKTILESKPMKDAFIAQIEDLTLFPEVEELGRRIKDSEITCYSMSNLSKDFVPIFERFGLHTWCMPIFSCECGHIKPSKEIYKIILNKHKNEEVKIFMIGDSYDNDYKAPRELFPNGEIESYWLNRKNKTKDVPAEHQFTSLLSFYSKKVEK
jgi:FMN phosphatase YigB (HAD superfamily)